MTAQPQRMFRYQGRSMWPCFQDGDLLDFLPCTLEELRIGDCLVYTTLDGRHVTHRVVGKSDVLLTRGDALAERDDEAVAPRQVLGKVVRRHRLGRSSKVADGCSGRLAGWFYRYAGRIDPRRDALGGTIARGVQNIAWTVLKHVWKSGEEQCLASGGDQETRFWMIGAIPIGKKQSARDPWEIAWPWNILFKKPLE